ncbi:ABC transporter substrate-binding protein [Iamia sp.]|uniref:ABC transporter substrate-binding protein n=1 Tax=Iamia sp. TaxID=2722710 RepID=UPI002B9633AF|nr:ABC transporter substrate-binding protein [Iamia sp.]HXH57421.1 ABC transporter substrate-binding protein [Iamia sp.]
MTAACGDDDEDTSGDTGAEESGGGGGDDALIIGRVLPETGPLAFLGPPMIEGIQLAVDDINEGGGVLGEDVTLETADEGETPQTARESATRLVNGGAHAIVGAAASGNSQEFIQLLFDEQIPQCSGSNTSPAFTDQENAEFFFRTVPPDEAVAPIIADTVIADGAAKVVVVARADDYGQALGDLVVTSLTDAGAEVPPLVSYDPEAANFNAEVSTIIGESPDAVVLISFDEGGQIVAGLLEGGITADQVYGSDGVFGPTFPGLVEEGNESVVDGMKVIGAAGSEEFNERIAEATDNNFIYGGQTYDCGIIIALAAEAAGSTDGEAIIAEVPGVTKEGEKCESFEDCKALLDDDEDIDYDGASGALELDEAGDPTQGRYAVGQFVDGALEIVDSQDVDV